MAKKICISREAHDRLTDLRRDGETFSEAILRISEQLGESGIEVGLERDER